MPRLAAQSVQTLKWAAGAPTAPTRTVIPEIPWAKFTRDPVVVDANYDVGNRREVR